MILKVPNELKDEEIIEYQKIYKETHGEDISFDEARELGLSLIRFIALIISDSGENS